MLQRHLNSRLLDKLLEGKVDDITSEEARELALHLMEACPDCANAVEASWPFGGDDVDRSVPVLSFSSSGRRAGDGSAPAGTREARGFDDVVKRVHQRVQATMDRLRESSSLAPKLVDELMRQPEPRRRLLVHNDRRFQSLPVAELLLDRAWETGFDRPAEAEELAGLVLEIVDFVEVEDLGEALLQDLRARAWAVRGNSLRIVSDYRGANEAFKKAWSFLAEGTGDLLERARLLTLESTLCRYQKRQEQAAAMLEETIRIYRALDETHLVGRTMVNQALLLYEQGEAARAIDALSEAQDLIDSEREPRIARVAQQNLMVYLSEVGRYEEAMAKIPSLRNKLIAEGTHGELLRLRWLEGTIHVGLGNDARAEAAFLEVRRGMLELDLPKDVAVVTLELAALYMRQRRTAEIRDLAAQMFPIFQSRDLHQEAIAALLLFQRAVEMDTLTLRMVEEVAEVVRRSQEKPRPQTPEPS